MDNTVDFLDDVKQKLRNTFTAIYYNSRNIEYDSLVSNEDFRKCVQIIKKVATERGGEIPEVLRECRTVEEFLNEVYSNGREKHEVLEAISDLLNPYINLIEEKMYEVEIVRINTDIPKDLTYISIVNDIANCEARIESADYSGAITSAKSLVEGVCKELLTILGEDTSDRAEKFPKLVSRTLMKLNLHSSNKKLDDTLKEITSGLSKTINGLNDIRNISGDSHSKTLNPSFHHAVLAVNAAKTITSFLFHTYEYQKEKGKLEIHTI